MKLAQIIDPFKASTLNSKILALTAALSEKEAHIRAQEGRINDLQKKLDSAQAALVQAQNTPPQAPIAHTPATRRFAQAVSGKQERLLFVEAGSLTPYSPATFEKAIDSALAWADERSGLTLPVMTVNDQGFLVDEGDKLVQVVSLPDPEGGNHLWAMEYRHPCNDIAGRVWSTEVFLGASGKYIRVGLRSHVYNNTQPVSPTIPGVLNRLNKVLGLVVDNTKLFDHEAVYVHDKNGGTDNADRIIDLIRDPARKLPVILASLPNDETQLSALALDLMVLYRRTRGTAHVYLISDSTNKHIKRMLGDRMSVYDGAIRLYAPDYDRTAHMMGAHPYLTDAAMRSMGAASALEHFINKAFSLSAQRFKDALPRITDLRQQELNIALKMAQKDTSSKAYLDLLEAEIETLKGDRDAALLLAAEEEAQRIALQDTVKAYEAQAEGQLGAPALNKGFYPPLSELVPWVDHTLGKERVYLHPRALKGAETSDYRYPDHIFDALRILGTDYYFSKLRDENGEGASLNRIFHERARACRLSIDGSISMLKKHFAGEYEVTVPWLKTPVFLTHHIGRGNSRDSRDCLRIYYAWEPEKQLVVVGSLPRHLTNQLT